MGQESQPFPRHPEEPLDFVLSNFIALERSLLDCMDYVPFIDQNRGIVSPKFIPIILESCGLIESIFRYMAGDAEGGNLRAYCQRYERRLNLENATSLFLTSRLHLLRPFHGWALAVPSWWKIYNGLKHDRIANYAVASFTEAVNALAGLHQVIARSDVFTQHLLRLGWINEDDEMNLEHLLVRLAHESAMSLPEMPAHSTLFVSPLAGSFVDWTKTPPKILWEDWSFTSRVKNYVWNYEDNEN